MKKIMLFKSIVITILFASNLLASELPPFVTLVSGDHSNGQNYIQIPEGYTVEILSLTLRNSDQHDPNNSPWSSSRLWISEQGDYGNNIYIIAGTELHGLPKFNGPIALEVDYDHSGANGLALANLKIAEISDEEPYISKSAIVVPSEFEGNVEVDLQGSSDLINWTSVEPGTFGSGTSMRFFRASLTLRPNE